MIANAGLDQILEFSVPVLNILYPPAIVLILLSFLPERLQRLRAIYPAGILFTGAASILYTVQGLGAAVPVLDGVLSAVPWRRWAWDGSCLPWPASCWELSSPSKGKARKSDEPGEDTERGGMRGADHRRGTGEASGVPFRAKFRLSERERAYIGEKGWTPFGGTPGVH